jgi:NAD(P)-dependent dehydrogenase (short-subunit alcohol dehydrogenase family)
MDLKGKNILVTGGGGFGVGAGICDILAACGARLVINELDAEKAASAGKKYAGALALAADISKSVEVETMFRQIKNECGVIHGLVNNAGIGLSRPAHEASEQEFDNLYGVDVRGVWMVSKLFVKQLLDEDITGNIVNVSSVHARSTIPGYAIYASAKSAVEGLTRGMAVELGRQNIRVNAIAPGYVHAEQNYDLIRSWTENPEQWVEEYIFKEQVIHLKMQPGDCGYSVAFLLSEYSRCITGQTLYIDCGTTIKLLGSV